MTLAVPWGREIHPNAASRYLARVDSLARGGIGLNLMCCERKMLPAKAGLWMTLGCLAALGGSFNPAPAAPPRISYIILTNVNNVRFVDVHFPTEANRAYVLQGLNTFSCTNNCNSRGVATNWINLKSYFSSPITNHYIYHDSLSNKTRFYRLRVTP